MAEREHRICGSDDGGAEERGTSGCIPGARPNESRERHESHDGTSRERNRWGSLMDGSVHADARRDTTTTSRRRAVTIGAGAFVMLLALIAGVGFFVSGSMLRGARAELESPAGSPAAAAIAAPARPILPKHQSDLIQRKIDGATDGAVIDVEPGVYEGTIDFRGKRVVLRSLDGAAITIIDAAGAAGPVVVMRDMTGEGPLPRLHGFTLRGGRGPSGSGLLVERASPIVSHCVFEGNTGSGLRLIESDALVDECRFIGNSASLYGGGASAVGGKPVFASCEFTGNYTVTGGGALCLRRTTAIILACAFTGNRVTSGAWGGALFGDASDLTICDTTFERNGSGEEGGAIYVHEGRAKIDRCAFEGNAAPSAWSVLGQAAQVRVRETRFCGPIEWNIRADSLDERSNQFVDDCFRDCNGNGLRDDVEIADELTTDCDGSGIPDSCKMDCDGDGMPDACAIAMGLARDDDGNGIPDDCEVAMGLREAPPSAPQAPWTLSPLRLSR